MHCAVINNGNLKRKTTLLYKIKLLCIVMVLINSFQVSAQNNDTFKLYFDLNIPTINTNTEKRLDLLIYNDKIINGTSIMIIGYADYLGTEDHNKELSINRSQNVKNYLVHHGIKANDIKLCIGKGQINRKVKKDKDGYPTDRRVDIVVSHEPKKVIPELKKDAPSANAKRDSPIIIKKVVISDLTEITALKAGSTIVLENVYFPADRHVLKPESYGALEKLFDILKNNPKLKISIEGHVCCIVDADDAFDIDTGEPILSVNRAKAIYDYLISKGIDAKRLQYEGFGKSHPVVRYERSEEDAEKNRRVEIRIVDNK